MLGQSHESRDVECVLDRDSRPASGGPEMFQPHCHEGENTERRTLFRRSADNEYLTSRADAIDGRPDCLALSLQCLIHDSVCRSISDCGGQA